MLLSNRDMYFHPDAEHDVVVLTNTNLLAQLFSSIYIYNPSTFPIHLTAMKTLSTLTDEQILSISPYPIGSLDIERFLLDMNVKQNWTVIVFRGKKVGVELSKTLNDMLKTKKDVFISDSPEKVHLQMLLYFDEIK